MTSAGGLRLIRIVRKISLITQKIKQESPKTKLYLQSILPVTDYYKMFGGHTSQGNTVKQLNEKLSELSDKRENYLYRSLFFICR